MLRRDRSCSLATYSPLAIKDYQLYTPTTAYTTKVSRSREKQPHFFGMLSLLDLEREPMSVLSPPRATRLRRKL